MASTASALVDMGRTTEIEGAGSDGASISIYNVSGLQPVDEGLIDPVIEGAGDSDSPVKYPQPFLGIEPGNGGMYSGAGSDDKN